MHLPRVDLVFILEALRLLALVPRLLAAQSWVAILFLAHRATACSLILIVLELIDDVKTSRGNLLD